jgi:hypothetical protein
MLSIVKINNNRIAKYAEFATAEEADAHSLQYGGFTYNGNYSPDLFVAGQTVTIQPIVQTVIDESDISNIQKHIKAAVLAAAIMSGKTPAQAKAAFKAAWDSL